MATIRNSVESKRGCGYRKKGGIYLRSDGIGVACGKLPIELSVCPHCNQGIKPTRGFAWISTSLLISGNCDSPAACATCPFNDMTTQERIGLMWVGGSFYPTPSHFTKEAMQMGVSKRISQIPKDLKIGETWIAIAHREVNFAGVNKPGIFHAFKPARIEYVVWGTETEEELERLEKRGLELVNVIPDMQTVDVQEVLFEDSGDDTDL